MPRKPLIRSETHPYHIHTRSNNKDWFSIPLNQVWNYLNRHLHTGSIKFNVEIHAYILMNNHYHLIASTPKANIDKFMHHLNKNLGKSLAQQSNRINRIFGSPYKWSLIAKQSYYANVYRYVYQNSVRANIVKEIEDYPYSSLYRKKLSSLINLENVALENPMDFEWLNESFEEKETEAIRKGLKRYEFRPGRDEKHWKREDIIRS